MKIKNLLIANRGEIACRVIEACKSLGIRTIAVYSEADRFSRHVKQADVAVLLGTGEAKDSYLNIEKIISACREQNADAVHPGYGFLSERAEFARAVIQAGFIWVGPQPDVIDLMGSKIEAKRQAEKANVPTLPWALVPANFTEKQLIAEGTRIGFPLLLKASAGGGGRGMRLVEAPDQLLEKAQAASREALSAFGNGELFIEKYCPRGRHLEVQLLGDVSGQVVVFGERECSTQRRHQKVIEEAPAANIRNDTRNALLRAAQNLGQSVGYTNAGTCEFLLDEKENFYFLEINARLQVEHPVTEAVWGVDLVRLQLEVAQGNKLADVFDTNSLQARGHCIEARIYAEDPENQFMPSPGKLKHIQWPTGSHIRVDFGYESGDEIPIFYDAMLAKVIAFGQDREQARLNLRDAITHTQIDGVKHNLFYIYDILNLPKFIDSTLDTQFLIREYSHWKASEQTKHKFVAQTQPPHRRSENDLKEISPWHVFKEAATTTIKNYARTRGLEYTVDAHTETEFDSELVNTDSPGSPIKTEYPGKIIKVTASNGQAVKKGDVLVVCESMKMEFSYSAKFDGVVDQVTIKLNDLVTAGTTLVTFKQ